MEESPYVSIVVPAFNDKDGLERLLPSLLEQVYPLYRYEIIIIDDGSTDNIMQFIMPYQCMRLPQVRYIFQKHKGPAAARNLGIKNSNGAIIAFTDSDCVAANTWLQELINGYARDYNNAIGAVGGYLRIMPNNHLLGKYCSYIYSTEVESQINNKNNPKYLITANISFRKHILDLIGGFDERFTFPGGEDQDICYRLKAKGYILKSNLKAIIYHQPKKTVCRLLKTQYNYGKGEAFIVMDRGRSMLGIPSSIRAFLSIAKIPKEIFGYCKKGFHLHESFVFSILDYFRKITFFAGLSIGLFAGKNRGFILRERI